MKRNVLEYLEDSASDNPNKVAVIEGAHSITYIQLQEKSRRIGTALSSMITAKEPVGLYMEKGIDALCSFFGTVYAGGCYSMLNPGLPEARLKQISEVLQLRVIVTTAALMEAAKSYFPGVKILDIESLTANLPDEKRLEEIRSHRIDTDPLYINFTSGSTGVPKGIVVCHRSVIDFMECFTELFHITGEDVIANQAPFDFDVSVKDIYSAMKTGATLVIVAKELFSKPTELLDCLCDHQVTTMIWAVSALCLITTFHGLDYRQPVSVNKILFSGEIMPYKHLKEWQKHLPNAMYVNLYGPTEITCNCTYHILEADRDYESGLPIGKAFPNEDVFLIDAEGKTICDSDIPGEIIVRGTALALGYYNMPDKTAEHFVQNPAQSAYPELVYKTGDVGKYNALGEIMFCGRVDNQVKHMGHRIEMEEVEHSIERVDGVERCFCIYDEKKSRIKAYYVGSIEKKELHQCLSETLPIFMIPGFMRQIDSMVLSKNGKIDRKATLAQLGD
ncbi:MAG: amino acid adenylation domain-containing protein [Lachnospiraceae bacterium]|nr:amino acid adenylation domain-containing protein [Lachnospiraceae bacterium]